MGLSAEELNAETLFPGDTIEYFSMAFVAGDPRGHRVAKVLKVLKDEPEYPLRLESQELLPITLMIRRKLDRHDDEIDPAVAKWRKIRTFKLVTGEVKGKTRADRLNEGLKQVFCLSVYTLVASILHCDSMTSAIQTAKATFAAQKGSISEPFKDDEMAEKRAKKKKKKIKPEPKSEWFQQQQLSFFKRDAPKDKDKGRDRDKDDFQAKRVSLDSMSRREEDTGYSASSSSSSPQRLRKEESSSALKHKKPRLLLSSPSPPLSQQKPPRVGALLYHKKSSSSPFKSRDLEKKKKRLPAAVASPPSLPRESKYFSGSLQKYTKKPNGSLLQFMDEIEEKKSSRGTTLDEYLALDREQKSLIQKLKRPKSDDGDVETRTDKSSSSSSNGSKWERDRQNFRAKPQQESRWKVDSQFLSNWLKSGSKQQQQQQQATKKSDRQSSFSSGRRTSLDRPKNGTTLSGGQSPKRKDLNFLMIPLPKATEKQQQQQQLHKQQDKHKRNDENDRGKDRDLHRKRKRSSDFSSPTRRPHKASERSRAQSPTTPDLMGTWISKKRG